MNEFGLSIKELQALERSRKILDSCMRHIYDNDPDIIREDGTLRITFPGFLEQGSGCPLYTIELFTISLGDKHKYVFEDRTLLGVLTKLSDQLEEWVQEL